MKNTVDIKWYGLFGNNVEQIAGSIFYAKCCKGITQINLPRNNYFSATSLIIENEYDYNINSPRNLIWDTNSYYKPILKIIDLKNYASFLKKNILKVYRNDVYKFVHKNLKFDQYEILNLQNAYALHLRSGDILTEQNSHPLFVQAPFSFFRKILSEINLERIIICTQNLNLNPNYEKIIEYCNDNNIIIDNKNRSLNEDAFILSNSEKIILGGASSFSLTCAYMNNNCSDLYYPNFNVSENSRNDLRISPLYDFCYSKGEYSILDKSIKLHRFKFENYFNIGEWKYDSSTKEKMLEYQEKYISEY